MLRDKSQLSAGKQEQDKQILGKLWQDRRDSGGAFTMAEALRLAIKALNISHEYSNVCKAVTVSLGVASIIPEHSTSFKILIEQADKALYYAKQMGRNRVEVYSPDLLEDEKEFHLVIHKYIQFQKYLIVNKEDSYRNKTVYLASSIIEDKRRFSYHEKEVLAHRNYRPRICGSDSGYCRAESK